MICAECPNKKTTKDKNPLKRVSVCKIKRQPGYFVSNRWTEPPKWCPLIKPEAKALEGMEG